MFAEKEGDSACSLTAVDGTRVGHRPLSGGGHTSFDFGYEFDAQVLPSTFYAKSYID